MKVAINQPYFFPYIGYFQLINAVDLFVFYDDVNFIKQSWINRNKILVANKEFLFTVPLVKASSFCEINVTKINLFLYEKWKNKFFITLEQSYKKAPYYNEIFGLINQILQKDIQSIATLAIESCIIISKYLKINTHFEIASERYASSKGIGKEERIFYILNRNNSSEYINTIAGLSLYNKKTFYQNGIELYFLKTKPFVYKQFSNEFIPWLSIIDVLMFNSVDEIKLMLDSYELV